MTNRGHRRRRGKRRRRKGRWGDIDEVGDSELDMA